MKGIIILAALAIIVGVSLIKFVIQPIMKKKGMSWKAWGFGTILGILLLVGSGSFYYAEPGHSYLVQYPWGTQVSHLTPGYHFYWYGTVLDFKKVITVRLTDEKDDNSETATETDNSVQVRFNDSVRATVSSSTRFRLPENDEQFKKLAVDYRTQANLVQASLVPVTKEVIRNSARELSAQDYVTGQGGQFEQNVLDQLENGIVVLKLEDELVPIKKTKPEIEKKAEETSGENDEEKIAQTDKDRGVKTESRIYQRVIRMTNADGSLKRKAHPLVQYGIAVTQSTIERVHPEKKFQEMLAKQRDAAAKAAVSRQQAKQAEYERQKVLAEGETEKAKIKMQQEQQQVQKLVSAETAKKQAEIDLDTSKINKQKAEVDAEALLIAKKAESEGKKMLMAADGALGAKLETYLEVQKAYAQAFAQHRMVPDVVIGGEDGKGGSEATQLMNLLMAKSAKDLSLDMATK